jgi:hypothetical protein
MDMDNDIDRSNLNRKSDQSKPQSNSSSVDTTNTIDTQSTVTPETIKKRLIKTLHSQKAKKQDNDDSSTESSNEKQQLLKKSSSSTKPKKKSRMQNNVNDKFRQEFEQYNQEQINKFEFTLSPDNLMEIKKQAMLKKKESSDASSGSNKHTLTPNPICSENSFPTTVSNNTNTSATSAASMINRKIDELDFLIENKKFQLD